jgi:hypothetical protein
MRGASTPGTDCADTSWRRGTTPNRIVSDAHLLAVYRYDANNPVKAGLCDAPQDWPWCSYGALFRPTDMYSFVDPTRVLERLGGSRASAALEKLRLLVEGVWVL